MDLSKVSTDDLLTEIFEREEADDAIRELFFDKELLTQEDCLLFLESSDLPNPKNGGEDYFTIVAWKAYQENDLETAKHYIKLAFTRLNL